MCFLKKYAKSKLGGMQFVHRPNGRFGIKQRKQHIPSAPCMEYCICLGISDQTTSEKTYIDVGLVDASKP